MCQLTQPHYKFCGCTSGPARAPCPEPSPSCDALLSSSAPKALVLHCYCPRHSNAGFLTERKALSRSGSNPRSSRPPPAERRPNVLRRLSSRTLEIPERPASVAGVIEENSTSTREGVGFQKKGKSTRTQSQNLTRANPGSKSVRYLRPISILGFNFGFDGKDKQTPAQEGMEKDKEIIRPIPRRPVGTIGRSQSVMGRPQSAGSGAVILKDPELLRRRSRLMMEESVTHPSSLTPGITPGITPGTRRMSRMVEVGLEKDKQGNEARTGVDTDPGFEEKDKDTREQGQREVPKTFDRILRRTASEKDKEGLARRYGDWEDYVKKQRERVENWKAKSRLRKKERGEKGGPVDGECRVM